jgi:hypothetical protein
MEVAGRFNTAAVFEEVVSNYARAVDAAGGFASDDYVIAGAPVSLRFAGAALRERFTPAFAHLVAPASGGLRRPSLTVHLWDSASTGIEPPPRPRAGEAHAVGALYHLHEPPLRVAYQPGLDTLSILDTQANAAWHWVRDASAQSSWEQACPIRQILFWWLASRGYLQIHGAAVGTPVGGVVLVGQPGAGKSTVALACLGSELLYAGDDYVAATLDPAPAVASLYNSGKVGPDHVRERLPNLRPLLAGANLFEGEKAVFYVHEHLPGSTTSGFPLEALLVPKFDASRRESSFAEIPRASAFAALAPSTMFQLHTAGKDELSTMSNLVAGLPCYAFEFGPDLSTIPAMIGALISKLSSDRRA